MFWIYWFIFASERCIDLNIAEINNFTDLIKLINDYKNNKEKTIKNLKQELSSNFFFTKQEKLLFFCADGQIFDIKRLIYKRKRYYFYKK